MEIIHRQAVPMTATGSVDRVTSKRSAQETQAVPVAGGSFQALPTGSSPLFSAACAAASRAMGTR